MKKKFLFLVAALAVIMLNLNVVLDNRTGSIVELGTVSKAFAYESDPSDPSSDSDPSGEAAKTQDHVSKSECTTTSYSNVSSTEEYKKSLETSLKTSLSGNWYVTEAEVSAAVSAAINSLKSTTMTNSTKYVYTRTLWKNDCFGVGTCTGAFEQKCN